MRVSGKADETEEGDEDDAEGEGDGDGEEGKKRRTATKAEKEKRKMRGKNKSLKRYLRKQRKNVIDPRAVSRSARRRSEVGADSRAVCRSRCARNWKRRRRREERSGRLRAVRRSRGSRRRWTASNGRARFVYGYTLVCLFSLCYCCSFLLRKIGEVSYPIAVVKCGYAQWRCFFTWQGNCRTDLAGAAHL